ncbi:MAG: ArsR/SmtB family transcription factor [Halobacteriaceae archaeon]
MSDETTSGGLPYQPSVSVDSDRDSRVLAIDEADADAVFDALSSQTAREILAALHAEPRPPSELATAADTTVQNVRYHLEKFEAAGLVEVVDTWYSSRGMEMDVYAPTDEALVLYAGDTEPDDERSARDVLVDLLGAIGVLGLLSLLVDQLVRRFGATSQGPGGPQPRDPVAPGDHPFLLSPDGPMLEIGGVVVPPGALFFLGGTVVLLAITVWRRRQ